MFEEMCKKSGVMAETMERVSKMSNRKLVYSPNGEMKRRQELCGKTGHKFTKPHKLLNGQSLKQCLRCLVEIWR